MKMQDMRRRALVSMALALPRATWADERIAGGRGRDIEASAVTEPMSAHGDRERDHWGLVVRANPMRLD